MPRTKSLTVNSPLRSLTKKIPNGPTFKLNCKLTLMKNLMRKKFNSEAMIPSLTTPKNSTMLGMPSRMKKRVTTELSHPTSLVIATTSS